MMMPGIPELLIITALAALVFGTSKLKNVGKDLGGAISDFKSGLKEGKQDKEGEKDEKKEEAPAAPSSNAESKPAE